MMEAIPPPPVAEPVPMSLQFLIVAGPDKDRVLTIQPGPDLMLGRSQHCFYQLSDPRVSRNHCQVLLDGEQATVIDNASHGGVFVNGQKVARAALKLGDVL